MKNFKLILKSLISNASCVEGGRHRPWYFAVIMALLSLAIAIIPTFVQTYTKSGEQIVSTNNYNVKLASQRFTEDINNRNIRFDVTTGNSAKIIEVDSAINEFTKLANEQAHDDKLHAHFTFVTTNAGTKIPIWIHKNLNNVIDFQVYVLTEAQYIDQDVLSTVGTYKVIEGETETTKKSSFLILSTKYAALSVIKDVNGTYTSVGTIYGDYVYAPSPYSINSFNGNRTTAQIEEEFPLSKSVEREQYRTDTWENWKYFYKVFYNSTRLTSSWQTTLLILGIDAALMLFMGLMIWILTRGKNNPFRIYTFWESQKISYWCAITPALLTCGLSFLITSFSQIFFALFIGVRVMWLSMKTLRPDAVAPSQANYAKNVKTVDVKSAKK